MSLSRRRTGSPRFTAVAELKLAGRGPRQVRRGRFSTVHRRGRIEAARNALHATASCVGSPRFTAVAELKPAREIEADIDAYGSPRFTAVAELKPPLVIDLRGCPSRGSPRFTAVAELKPAVDERAIRQVPGFSTVHRRGRIEAAGPVVSPSNTVGVLHGSPPWPN